MQKMLAKRTIKSAFADKYALREELIMYHDARLDEQGHTRIKFQLSLSRQESASLAVGVCLGGDFASRAP
jgi:hypothetical protein